MGERRCKARDDAGFWWGADLIDSSEPGFVKGKGIFIPETVPCPYMPLPEVDLCYRHSFLKENRLTELAISAAQDEANESDSEAPHV